MSIYLVQNYIYLSVMKATQALLTPAIFACSYIKMVHYITVNSRLKLGYISS